MSITSSIVLYMIIWFMVFFIALPIRIRTQGEEGHVEPGTPSGAPQVHYLKRKAVITTLVAAVIWAGVVAIILSGMISIRDFDWFNRMGPGN